MSKEYRGKYVIARDGLDEEMIPIIEELNRKGYKTSFCCQGHIDENHKFDHRECMYISFPGKYSELLTPPGYELSSKSSKKYVKVCNYKSRTDLVIYWYTSRNCDWTIKEEERKQFIKEISEWTKNLPFQEGYQEFEGEVINPRLVFVCGDFMKGRSLNKILLGRSRYLEKATLPGYSAGYYVRKNKDNRNSFFGNYVEGEIYEVSEEDFALLCEREEDVDLENNTETVIGRNGQKRNVIFCTYVHDPDLRKNREKKREGNGPHEIMCVENLGSTSNKGPALPTDKERRPLKGVIGNNIAYTCLTDDEIIELSKKNEGAIIEPEKASKVRYKIRFNGKFSIDNICYSIIRASRCVVERVNDGYSLLTAEYSTFSTLPGLVRRLNKEQLDEIIVYKVSDEMDMNEVIRFTDADKLIPYLQSVRKR